MCYCYSMQQGVQSILDEVPTEVGWTNVDTAIARQGRLLSGKNRGRHDSQLVKCRKRSSLATCRPHYVLLTKLYSANGTDEILGWCKLLITYFANLCWTTTRSRFDYRKWYAIVLVISTRTLGTSRYTQGTSSIRKATTVLYVRYLHYRKRLTEVTNLIQ